MSERIVFFANPVTGTRVLLLDFSGVFTAADALPIIGAVRAFVAQQQPQSLYCLVDVAGSKFNSDSVEAMKELVAHNRPFVIASALVGVTGLQRVILDGVLVFTGRKNLKSFPSRDDALGWLAAQEKANAA